MKTQNCSDEDVSMRLSCYSVVSQNLSPIDNEKDEYVERRLRGSWAENSFMV